MVEGFSQVEQFLISSALPGRQQNGSVRLQVTWTPHRAAALVP